MKSLDNNLIDILNKCTLISIIDDLQHIIITQEKTNDRLREEITSLNDMIKKHKYDLQPKEKIKSDIFDIPNKKPNPFVNKSNWQEVKTPYGHELQELPFDLASMEKGIRDASKKLEETMNFEKTKTLEESKTQ